MTSRAALYCRISNDDKDDDRPDDKGVSRQQREGLRYAGTKDYTVVDVFVDNDLGASSRSRAKTRPAWESLIEAVKRGDVDVIVARDLDRLTRRMREIEDLVELAEATGVRFDLYRGHLDLESASGRQMARMMGSVAAGESDRTAERVASQRRDAASRGRPVVTVEGFGWRHGLPVPDEADAIRTAAVAVVGGSSLASIARTWNAAGLRRRRTDAPWRSQEVRVVLANPRHAGQAVYRGQVVGDLDGPRILDPALAESLHAVLHDPARGRGPRRRRAFSGIMRCGRCGAVMRRGHIGTPKRSGWSCSPDPGCGRVAISADLVESTITEAVLSLFDAGVPTSESVVDPEVAAELRRLDDDAAALGEAHGRGEVPLAAFVAASKAMTERRRDLVARLTPQRHGAALAPFTEPGALRRAWPSLDEPTRNTVLRAVIDSVVVRPAVNRGPKSDPLERIDVRWRA